MSTSAGSGFLVSSQIPLSSWFLFLFKTLRSPSWFFWYRARVDRHRPPSYGFLLQLVIRFWFAFHFHWFWQCFRWLQKFRVDKVSRVKASYNGPLISVLCPSDMLGDHWWLLEVGFCNFWPLGAFCCLAKQWPVVYQCWMKKFAKLLRLHQKLPKNLQKIRSLSICKTLVFCFSDHFGEPRHFSIEVMLICIICCCWLSCLVLSSRHTSPFLRSFSDPYKSRAPSCLWLSRVGVGETSCQQCQDFLRLGPKNTKDIREVFASLSSNVSFFFVHTSNAVAFGG